MATQLIGHSAAFQDMTDAIAMVAPVDSSVLLLGEQRELSALFYVGVAIILSAVFVHPLISRPRTLSQPELLGTAEAKQLSE